MNLIKSSNSIWMGELHKLYMNDQKLKKSCDNVKLELKIGESRDQEVSVQAKKDMKIMKIYLSLHKKR